MQIAIGTLASLDWDLKKATEALASSPMDTDNGGFSDFMMDSVDGDQQNG